MKFILQVEVTTEGDDDDLFTVANSDRSKWRVISGNPVSTILRPQTAGQSPGGKITGSSFQRTTTVPTP